MAFSLVIYIYSKIKVQSFLDPRIHSSLRLQ